MDTKKIIIKDIEFLNSYLSEFRNILTFINNEGYFYDNKKNLWVIQKPKNIYIYVRSITEKYFPKCNISDKEVYDWVELIKKYSPKIRLSSNLILTNNKVYNIDTKTYSNCNKLTKNDYIYIYTPINIKRIKRL